MKVNKNMSRSPLRTWPLVVVVSLSIVAPVSTQSVFDGWVGDACWARGIMLGAVGEIHSFSIPWLSHLWIRCAWDTEINSLQLVQSQWERTMCKQIIIKSCGKCLGGNRLWVLHECQGGTSDPAWARGAREVGSWQGRTLC